MRRINPRPVILLGILLVIGGLLLTLDTPPVYSQGGDSKPADYIGSDKCASCHRDMVREHGLTAHGQALVDVSKNKDLIKADFSKGETERTITFPDESKARPFTPDDIEYVIGTGRYVERYVYRIARGKFAVFPAEWNVEKQQWQSYSPTPAAQGATWPTDAAYDFVTNCAGCHTTDLNVARGRWGDDGVQCEACHGPGSIHADLAKDAGRKPDAEQVQQIHAAIIISPDAQVCGQCHSQGQDTVNQRPYPTGYLPGQTLLDDKLFTLVKNDDPTHWWVTGHGKSNNMQFNEWLLSRHSKSLDTLKSSPDAAAACLECHSADYRLNARLIEQQKAGVLSSAPELPTVDTAQASVSCIGCHDPHKAVPTDPQAKPDFQIAADSDYALCTSCHRSTDVTKALHHPVKDMFEGLPVVEGIAGIPSDHFSAADGPRCQTCHVPRLPVGDFTLASHALSPVMPGKTDGKLPDACSGCHDDLSRSDLQALIDDTQTAVRGRITLIEMRLGTIATPAAGSPAAAQYDQVQKALAFVKNDGSFGVHNYAYVNALLTSSERSLSELSVPGATLNPTEAPAPTATPSEPIARVVYSAESARTGVRPMTVILITATLLTLFVGAVVFLRRPRMRKGG
ncbi:MAG: hypothetical protein KF716_13735 [Anaerolineae bacterium]|nr:hypothetical protein [Anaerolineae bacterium]